jgi:hypothetical protein
MLPQIREVGISMYLQSHVQSIPRSLGAKLKSLMNGESRWHYAFMFHIEPEQSSAFEHVGRSL